jgi:hypothetical protein
MIDKCKYCDFKNVYTCNECEPSYFLVNFWGSEKGKSYQDCWKKGNLMMAIAALLYCPCIYASCMYCLYKKAQNIIMAPPVSGGVEVKKKIKPQGAPQQDDVNLQGTGAPPQPTVNVGGGGQPQQPNAPINIGQPNQNQGYNPPGAPINIGNP